MFNSVSVWQGFIRSLLCLIITVSQGFLVQYMLSLFLHICRLFPSVCFITSFSVPHQQRLRISKTSDLNCLFLALPLSNSKYPYWEGFESFNTSYHFLLLLFSLADISGLVSCFLQPRRWRLQPDNALSSPGQRRVARSSPGAT